MASSTKTAGNTQVDPKKAENKKIPFRRKSAIFGSLMRATAKQHGFLHIGAHLVAKGVLGQMGQIQPIFTCI